MGGVKLPGPVGFRPYLLGQPPHFCGAQQQLHQLHQQAPRLHDYAADLRRADRCWGMLLLLQTSSVSALMSCMHGPV